MIRKRLPLDSLPLSQQLSVYITGFYTGLLFSLSTPPVRAKQSRGLAAHRESKEAEQRSLVDPERDRTTLLSSGSQGEKSSQIPGSTGNPVFTNSTCDLAPPVVAEAGE